MAKQNKPQKNKAATTPAVNSSNPLSPNLPLAQQPAVPLIEPRLQNVAYIIGKMIIAGGIILVITLLWPLISMLITTTLPFAVGLVFAYICDPIVTFVQRRLKLSRIGGVIILYTIIGATIVGFIAMILPTLIFQLQDAWVGIADFTRNRLQSIPQYSGILEQIQTELQKRGLTFETLLSGAATNEQMQDAAKSAAASGVKVFSSLIEFFLGFISTVFGMFTFILFAVLVNMYLLLDFSKIRGTMEVLIPIQHQERTFDVLAKVDVAVGGFMRGTIITAFLVGVMTFVGLFGLGVRQYALLMGILAGFGNLVPYLGPIAGGIPALLYVLLSDEFDGGNTRLYTLGGIVALLAVIQTIEGFVLQPRVVGKSAQLNPITVLFALALGANFGILGMILAVPIACIARVLIKEFYWDKQVAENLRHKGGKKSQKKPEPAEA